MSLARYNLRVMMFNNWWLVVFPVAASQLTVYWEIISQRFSPVLPAATVEMVSPLLAAFLCAHTLAAEYRSGMGVILASKPMHIGKIVLLRLLASLALVWILAGLSLAAYYYGMEPYDVVRPALACIPSTLFLALLALTFATMLRHALAGFGIAALYWALDLPSGPAMHPYLSLKSLASSYAPAGWPVHVPFAPDWWIAKVVLLVGALILYLVHARLVFSLGTPMTVRRARRGLAWAAAIVVGYVVSSAVVKVGYGYTHRGQLWPDDPVWFRRQFAAYGPLPIASLFGPAFAGYVGDIPNSWRIQNEDDADAYGDTVEHAQALHRVIDRAPRSVWAPSAAALLPRFERRRLSTTEERAKLTRLVTDRYPDSPYADAGLRDAARIFADDDKADQAAAAYQEMLRRYPASRFRAEALGYVAEHERTIGGFSVAADLARQWAACAPIEDQGTALALLAEARAALHDRAGAAEAAQKALDAVRAYRRTVHQPGMPPDPRWSRWDADADIAQKRAEAVLGGA